MSRTDTVTNAQVVTSPGEGTAAAPSGRQFEIASGMQRAVVVDVGSGLRTYSAEGRDVLDGYAVDEMCSAGRGRVLIPWPNRVQDGRYEFAGRQHRLALSEPERQNAIHGLVRRATWTVGELARRVAPASVKRHLAEREAERERREQAWCDEQAARLQEQRDKLAAGEPVRCECCLRPIESPADATEKHGTLVHAGDCEQQWGSAADDEPDEEVAA